MGQSVFPRSMKEKSWQELLKTVVNHPGIASAAITGSAARPGGGDRYSDLDLLVVAPDADAVRDVRAWFPSSLPILICAVHLTHYCTVLFGGDLEKIDLAVYSADDPPSAWVVGDYRLLKGDAAFEAELAKAAAETHGRRAAHLNRDVSLDNILLLLATGLKRVRRGEELSAHALVAMAADMAAALEKRQTGTGAGADLLDPRRRLEVTHPALARVLQESLFDRPDRGIRRLARYVAGRYAESITAGQAQVLNVLVA